MANGAPLVPRIALQRDLSGRRHAISNNAPRDGRYPAGQKTERNGS